MNKPTHDEVSQRAQLLWHNQGRPVGRDDEIWLEAERELARGASVPKHTLGESQSDHAQSEKAAQQRKDARAPIAPHTSAPNQKPAESGKPLWDKPHSK